MLKRLLIGLVKGAIVGGLLVAGMVQGLGVSVWGSALAYAAVALTGLLVGLIAGKPIWASDAKVEAGLKAVAGAVLASAVLFAARRWVDLHLNLGALGSGALGDLPVAMLPLIAVTLSILFEIDNTEEKPNKTSSGSAPRQRLAAGEEGSSEELETIPSSVDARRERRQL